MAETYGSKSLGSRTRLCGKFFSGRRVPGDYQEHVFPLLFLWIFYTLLGVGGCG